MGDVFIRLVMYATSEDISEDQLKDRIIYKANKFREYIKQGIYSNL